MHTPNIIVMVHWYDSVFLCVYIKKLQHKEIMSEYLEALINSTKRGLPLLKLLNYVFY